MRLVLDHSAGARAVQVVCLTCAASGLPALPRFSGVTTSMHRLADVVIDLDGPAFQAYYCKEHAPAGSEHLICTDRDCAVCR